MIHIYNDSQGRKTSPACEACGKAPDMEMLQHVDHGRHYGTRLHARNRVRIEAYYANKVNRPDLANKRLCPECANDLVFIPLNR